MRQFKNLVINALDSHLIPMSSPSTPEDLAAATCEITVGVLLYQGVAQRIVALPANLNTGIQGTQPYWSFNEMRRYSDNKLPVITRTSCGVLSRNQIALLHEQSLLQLGYYTLCVVTEQDLARFGLVAEACLPALGQG